MLRNKSFIIFCLLLLFFFIFDMTQLDFISTDQNEEKNAKTTINTSYNEIVLLNSDSITKLFSSMQSKVTLIVMYASWCKSCVRKFPKMENLIKKYPSINPVVISLDNDIRQLKYFLAKQKSISFIPYNIGLDNVSQKSLLYEMHKIGLYFRGSIPYIAVLDDNMRPVIQGFEPKKMEKIIKKLVIRGGN